MVDFAPVVDAKSVRDNYKRLHKFCAQENSFNTMRSGVFSDFNKQQELVPIMREAEDDLEKVRVQAVTRSSEHK